MSLVKTLLEAWTDNCYICIVRSNTPFDKHSDQLVELVSDGIAIYSAGVGDLNVKETKYLFLVDDGSDEDFQRRLYKVVIPLLCEGNRFCCIYLRENSKCAINASLFKSGSVREINL